ncbi:MAG: alpha-galactosidase, partial [Lachnospiraceae bacterium]|nr:alpha-galactosidase [Lachnospiraceae bacterium]
MAKITDWINIEEDGICLVFGVTDEEQLKLLHFSSKPFAGMEEKEQYIQEGFQLVQVNFSGYNRPYEKHGNKHIVTAPGYLLTYVGMEDTRNEIGRRLVITQKDTLTGATVVSYLQFYAGTSTVRMYHEIFNEGSEEQTLEYVSSFFYLGVEKEGSASSDEKMK